MKLARVVLALPMLFGLLVLLYMSGGDLEKFSNVDLDRITRVTIFFDNSNKKMVVGNEDVEFIRNSLKTYKLRRVFSKEKQITEYYKLIIEDNSNNKAVIRMLEDNILSISRDGKRYHDFKITGEILNLDEILEIYNSY